VSELLGLAALAALAGRAVEMARARGAADAAATATRSRKIDVQWRDGKVETVKEATSRAVRVELYVDGRYSSVSTSDLRDDALARFLGESIALARSLEKDPYRQLPDPKLYAGRPAIDLAVRDPRFEAITAEDRRRAAQEIEAAARDVEGASAIVSVTATASDELAESARVASNGFEGAFEETAFWREASVTLKDADGRRPEDWEAAGTRIAADLPALATIGRGASRRAMAHLGAKKIASAKLPMIVEARSAGRLVGALTSAMTGGALQQKQSFLDGLTGKAIGSTRFTMIDDPLLAKGLGSRLFDGEGMTARRMPLVEAGTLRAFFVDTYYGRKLGLAPTTGRSSNLVFAPGTKALDALAAEAKEAIVVTGFLGGNSNTTTGDYSLGIQGYRVRGGKRAEPIVEMNVAGNQRDLWRKLAALGNDPYPYGTTRTPTLLFDEATFAGA